jgi:hypothetical protein
MAPVWGNLAVVTIAALYYAYRAYLHSALRRRKVLRERTAYMLWVMAERVDSSSTGRLSAGCGNG